MDKVTEAIALEADLLLKLKPLPEVEIFEFMKNLRGGTYFNMGMYSSIPVSRAYKSTIRIYKVIDLTAIVSGVSYENVGTTKDFRQATGEGPGKSWYDHTPGFENKVGQKKSDPNSKYVLWDIKRGTGTCVRYYVVDIDTGAVTPVSKDDVLQSDWLTQTEKNKLMPKPVVGIDLTTGQAVENKTVWRTAAFDHIFWLNQAGKSTQEYGVRFEEDFSLTEAADELFMDAHAHVRTDLDAILSGEVVESLDETPLKEATDVFMDAHAGVRTKLDDVLSGQVTKFKKVNESTSGNIIGFIDCSGSNYPINLDLQEKIANDLGATTLYYFSDRVYNTAEEAGEGSGTFYKDICAFAKANTDKNILVITDSDVDNDYRGWFGGDELKTIPNVKIERIEDHLQESVSTTSTGLKESYRRTVARGNTLVDNELFVDFE